MSTKKEHPEIKPPPKEKKPIESPVIQPDISDPLRKKPDPMEDPKPETPSIKEPN